MTKAQVLVIDGEAAGLIVVANRSDSRVTVAIDGGEPFPNSTRRVETLLVHCLSDGVDRYLVASSKPSLDGDDADKAWRLIRGMRLHPAWSVL